MEYIIIGLLVLLIVLVIVLIFKNNVKNSNEANMTERLGRFEININKEINDFKNELNRGLNEDFDKLNNKIETRLNLINDKVNERLDQNFEKTNKTFTNVLERLSKIDEAQKKIDGLSNDIVSLQSILTDKKSRGIFGEVNLKHILVSVFGEKNDRIYSLQYTLPNGTIADSVLFAPAPLGTIAIDSKFPLESYRMMVDKKLPQEIRERYEKQFKSDVKKHIDAISNKYIIEYAYRKKVWITSPTTLISTLTVIQMIIKNIERDKYTSVIHEELNKLGVEFSRYKERWDKLAKSIQTVNKDVESVYITTEKISKKFDVISGVEIDKINNEDYDKLNV